MTKIEKAIKYAKAQLTRLTPYVWGGQGEKLMKNFSVMKLCAMEDTADNAARVIKVIYKNKGKATKASKIFDCSGFVIKCLEYSGIVSKGYDTTADGLYKKYTPISTVARKAGDLAFRVDKNGHAYHVGILLDHDTVAHCKGRDWGLVSEPWTDTYWTACRRCFT